MEGGRGGFGYVNLHNYPLYRPSPPLTAIDRFLWGQKENLLVPKNGFFDFSSSCSNNYDSCSNGGGILWPSGANETIFVDGLLLDGETQNWRNDDVNPNLGLKDSESKLSVEKNCGGVRKKVKGGYSTNLIKGQWTDEEDRLYLTSLSLSLSIFLLNFHLISSQSSLVILFSFFLFTYT